MYKVEVYKDLISGITRTYDQWIDELIEVFQNEGLNETQAFLEAVSTIASYVREGEFVLV